MNTNQDQEGLDELIKTLLVPSSPVEEQSTMNMFFTGEPANNPMQSQNNIGNSYGKSLIGRNDESIVKMARDTKNSNLNSPMFTNVPEVAAKNPGATFINSTSGKRVETDLTSSLFEGLKNQMDLIGKEQDPLKKEVALSGLKGSVAEASANLMKKTREVAEQETGLPQLEIALANAERLDKADPLYSQHLTDSKATMQVRNQVEKAREKAGQLASRMVKENPTIAGMNSQLDGFIKMHESLVQKDLLKSDRRGDLIEQEKATLGPNTAKYLTYVFPDVNNDPTKAAEVKLQSRTDPNKADLKPFFNSSFTDADILPEAFSGNRTAAMVAIKLHASKMGVPEESVKKQLSDANQFVNNEAYFIEKLTEMGRSDPAYSKIATEYKNNAILGPKGKDADKAKQAARLNLVGDYLTKANTARTFNDVESWLGDVSLRNNPEISKVIDEIKTVNGNKSVSLESLMGNYIGKVPAKEKAARFQEVKKALNSHANYTSKGLYGEVDGVALNSKLTALYSTFNNSFSWDDPTRHTPNVLNR